VQFRSRNLVQVVMAALAYSGLSPLRLELEITESLLLFRFGRRASQAA
jgi:EAL domain-containing protein (putative c-di-GMP-specific phosphodiesterase class I)